ncbi:MAG: aldo/keto reductase [Gemmatimonadales bacterium]
MRDGEPELELEMNWRSFGNGGLKVTELCLGTMTLAVQADLGTSYAILDAACERGVRFLDPADRYPVPIKLATAGDTERLVGRWLAERGVRDDLVLASRAYPRATQVELPDGLKEHLDRAWYQLPRRPPELDTPRIPDFHTVVS